MKNKIRNALLALLVACMICVPLGTSWGDAGGFSGSSGYSSSSGGSSSSSGGGGSSSSSSGGGYYYGSSSSSDGDGEDLGAGIMVIVVVVFIVLIYSAIVSRRKAKLGGDGAGQVHIEDTFDESKVQPLTTLTQRDPAFDADDVAEDISNWYVRMQNAWTAGDFTPMQPYFSDALYAQFERQLKQIKDAGQTNHVENIAVLGVNIQGWYEQDGQDFLVARVQTRIIDYYTNNKTGEVVSGSKTIEKFMTYRYILSRTSVVSAKVVAEGAEGTAGTQGAEGTEGAAGTQGAESTGANVAGTEATGSSASSATSAASDAPAPTTSSDTQTMNCPNCGAVVDVNKSAKCPYCDSVLNAATHGWVITTIQGLEQRNGS